MRSGAEAAAGVEEGMSVARADLGLLAMVVIWGFNFSILKIGLESVDALGFNALRYPLASLMVFVVLRYRGAIPRPRREDVPRLITLGIVGNTLYQIFFILGLDRSRAGNASLLLAGAPVLTALFSAYSGHERLSPRVWGGVVAAFVGMALVVASGQGGLGLSLATITGDLLLISASVVWAVYTVGARDLIRRYGSVPVTAWTLWIGSIGIVLIGLPQVIRTDLTAIPIAGWASIAYAGVLGIGLAYLLWYQGVQIVGNTRTAAYSNLTPVLAVLIAWAWLGEVPTVWQAVGAVVIIVAVTVTRRGA